MSTELRIRIEKPFSFNELTKSLNDFVCLEEKVRGDNLHYYYLYGESSRGVDVSIVEERSLFKKVNYVDIRTTGHSSDEDYILANKIIENVLNLFEGTLYNEEGEEVKKLPYFSKSVIEHIERRAIRIVGLLVSENDELAIFGPIRKFYFGKEHLTFLNLEDYENNRAALQKKILYSQYGVPNYSYGDVMHVGKEEGGPTMKLVSNRENQMIDKFTMLLIDMGEDIEPLAITNDDLNTILPPSWQRTDAYTVVSPIIAQEEWDAFIIEATKLDKMQVLQNYL